MTDAGMYINIATFIAICGAIIKLTWGVSSQGRATDQHIDTVEASLKQEDIFLERRIMEVVDRKERESIARAETLRKDTGEMGSALRTKIHEIETWNRDTFVRKDSFELVVSRLEKSMEALGSKIEGAVDKMTAKVDAFQNQQHNRE